MNEPDDNNAMQRNKPNDDATQGPSLRQTIFSVLAAFFGVQSEANRERDFTKGSAKAFIIVGLVATLLFILTVWTVVRIVLSSVGAS